MATLKNILMLNALSSALSGFLLLVFAPAIADIFSVDQRLPFYITGAVLILFAGYIIYESLQKPVRPGRIALIYTLDALWVLGSVVIVALGLFNLSQAGYMLIGGVAIWVATMAYLQWKGLKHSTQ